MTEENFPLENFDQPTDKLIVIDEVCEIDGYEFRADADAINTRSGDLADLKTTRVIHLQSPKNRSPITLQEGFERMTAHPQLPPLCGLASTITTYRHGIMLTKAMEEDREIECRIAKLSELDEGIKETIRSARNYAISRSFTKSETLLFIDRCIQLRQEINCRLSVRDYYAAGVKLGLIAEQIRPKPDTRSRPKKGTEPVVHSSKADRKKLAKKLKEGKGRK